MSILVRIVSASLVALAACSSAPSEPVAEGVDACAPVRTDAGAASTRPTYQPGDYVRLVGIGSVLVPTEDGGAQEDTLNRPCHIGCWSIYQTAIAAALKERRGPFTDSQDAVARINACLHGCAATGGDAFYWPPAE